MKRPDIRRVAVPLFVLVWLSCAWFGSWAFNPNNSTRLFAAITIVEEGSARIDRFAALTIDKAEFEGHVYLDKAPGMTLIALPFVAAANAITGTNSAALPMVFGAPETEAFLRMRMRLVTIFVVATLTALAAVALLAMGAGLTGSLSAGLFGAIGFALGSTIWGWSTSIFGHAPAASLLVIATWAIWRETAGDAEATSWRRAAIAGLALGWAVLNEHPALITGAPIALWALWRMRGWPAARRWRAIAITVAAGSSALIALIGYNLFAFGTVFRVGYSGVTGFAGMQEGLFGLTYPKPLVLWEILFGFRRGIIWVAPVLLLAPFGIARLIRNPATRDIGWLATAVAVTAFLVNASYVYWDGGHSTGPRHAVPAIGFLALGLAAWWHAQATRAAQIASLTVLGVSIALNLMIAAAEITAPETYAFPIYDRVWLERFAPGALRTLPDEFWGWSPWAGFWLYLAIAAPIAAWLVRRLEAVRAEPL